MSSSFANVHAAISLAALLGGLGLWESARAQQNPLPACPSDTNVRWNNCQGTITYANGNKYIGEFRDGQRHGQAMLTFANGDRYLGEFRDDKRSGQGTYAWPDGRRYIGEFKDGQHHGQGILFAADGAVLQLGIWANGEFVRSANVTLRAPSITPSGPPFAIAQPPSPPASSATSPSAVSKPSSGTAFRIATGQFVTNHHVINGCVTVKVGGNPGGRVVTSDASKDLALVLVANDQGESASIRTTRIQLNESITAAGFPLEGTFSGIAITNGTISRLSGLRGDTGQVQISAPVQSGNSGGPLLDTAGNVIGVVTSKLNALKFAGASGDIPQNVNFAINGSSLRAFLDAKNVNYKEVSNESELTGVQIAARASAFTVLIECQR